MHTLDGRVLRAADLKGQVVVMHFWATWCTSCRVEMPALERFYRRHHQEGLEIVAVSIEEAADLARVREVATAYSYPAALAADSEVAGFGRIWVLPLTFVIDREGLLRYSEWTGEQRIDDAILEERLGPLLERR